MDTIKIVYYRMFQAIFNIGARLMHWRRPILVTGPGSIASIPSLLRESGVKKTLVITDPVICDLLLPNILKVLGDTGMPYVTFTQVEANPSVTTVNAIRQLYADQGCSGFVAVGGGSTLDAAKGAGALIVKPGSTLNKMAGLLKVGKTLPPLVAVPTTAGTGSETTIAALITDRETHHKYAIMDLHLVPKYAVLDPELTYGLPPHITATTGMDALTHAVEAYLCWTYNTKESIRMAEEAVVGIFKYLELAYNDGKNANAREEMLIASHKSGFAFTRAGVGNAHAIAHTLSGLYNTPHGLANAVILPIVLEDYGPAVHKKLAKLSVLAGIRTDGTVWEQSQAFIAEVRAMNKRMNIPTGFNDIQEKNIEQMITWALAEANPIYPVPVIYNRERCRKVIHRIITEC